MVEFMQHVWDREGGRPIARIGLAVIAASRFVLVKWPKERPGLTHGIVPYCSSRFVFGLPQSGQHARISLENQIGSQIITCYVILVGTHTMCLQKFSYCVNLDSRESHD